MKHKLLGASIFAVATLTAPAVAAAGADSVVVKSGDTLWSIANKHNVSVNQIKKWNNLKNETIFPGQRLVLNEKNNSNSNQKVSGQYSKVTGAEWLNVRTGPGINHSIIESIKKGKEVKLGKQSNDWVEIQYDNKKGYVNSSYLTKPYTKSSSNNSNNSSNNNSNSGSTTTHTVKSGDSLWSISVKYNVSVNEIKSLNNLKNDLIHPGQKLTIKSGSKGNTTTPSNNNNTNNNNSSQKSTYTVKSGDTLWSIASSHNISVNQLKSWNNLSSNLIVVGQKLTVSSSSNNNTAPNTDVDSVRNFNYVVTYGDSLSTIASKYKTTVEKIKSDNGLTSNTIYVNQTLNLDVSNITPLFIKPADGVYTSEYGPRWGRTHAGIDIAQSGVNPIKAAADGVVTRSYYHSTYGEVVFIEHNISGQIYETVYAHMRPDSRTVKVGDTVKVGQTIGTMGTTGNSTGQHLHFEVHVGKYAGDMSRTVNPRVFIK